MSTKKGGGGGSGHGGAWIITFADLVSLLMAFFVMIVSFSTQDDQKVSQAAGSIREAFGAQPIERVAGIIELDGLPVRRHLSDLGFQDAQHLGDTDTATTFDKNFGNSEQENGPAQQGNGAFSAVALALQEVLRNDPEYGDVSREVVLKGDEDGLRIEIANQDGRAMFGAGSATVNEIGVAVLRGIAPILDGLPNQIRIIGHTSADSGELAGGVTRWMLSARRAEAARDVLAAHGLSSSHFAEIVGAGDTVPMFADDAFLAGNRRVTILVEPASPPLPLTLRR